MPTFLLLESLSDVRLGSLEQSLNEQVEGLWAAAGQYVQQTADSCTGLWRHLTNRQHSGQ